MALTNFIITVAGVGAAILLIRSDIKQSAAIFRRNVRQLRHWLEEESSATAAKSEIKPDVLGNATWPKYGAVFLAMLFCGLNNCACMCGITDIGRVDNPIWIFFLLFYMIIFVVVSFYLI